MMPWQFRGGYFFRQPTLCSMAMRVNLPISRPAPWNFFSESIAPCDYGRPFSLGSAGDAPLTVLSGRAEKCGFIGGKWWETV